MADAREVMNIRQASQYLGVSPDTLYKYVSEEFRARLLRVHSVGNLREQYEALQTQPSQARQLWSQSSWCLCARRRV